MPDPELVYVSQIWDDINLDDMYAGLVADGGHVYTVAAGANPGILQVIDSSDPADLGIVGSETDNGLNGSVFGMAKTGNTVVVASAADGVLIAFDVTDPANPSFESSIVIPSGCYHIDAAGDYAYVPDRFTDQINVIDVSDPGSMSIASTYDDDTYINFPIDCKYRDGYLYVLSVVGGGSVTILDVSNPNTTPLFVGTVVNSAFGNSDHLTVLGDYVYVGGLSGTVIVVDVSTLTAPTFVRETAAVNWNACWDVKAVDGVLYVAQEQWVSVWDLTDPADPQEFASITTPGGARPFNAFGIAVVGEYIYTSNDTQDHVSVFQLLPVAVGYPGFHIGLVMTPVIVDPRDEPEPTLLDRVLTGNARDYLYYQDGYCGAASSDRYFVVDARDPLNLVQLYGSTENNATGIQIDPGADLFAVGGQTMRLRLLSTGNQIAAYTTSGDDEAPALDVANNLLMSSRGTLSGYTFLDITPPIPSSLNTRFLQYVSTGGDPGRTVLDSSRRLLWTARQNGTALACIDYNTVWSGTATAAWVDGFSNLSELCYDDDRQIVFSIDTALKRIYSFDASTSTPSIISYVQMSELTGSATDALGYDQGNQRLFATNQGSGGLLWYDAQDASNMFFEGEWISAISSERDNISRSSGLHWADDTGVLVSLDGRQFNGAINTWDLYGNYL